MINAIAAFGLGYLFFKFVQENGGIPIAEPEEDQPGEMTPPVPYETGKASAVLTSTYENGGYVLYRLEILQGQAYENPETGEVNDETYYQTVGYVVGDVGQTSFTTQNDSSGAYTFDLNGTTQENVRIYTEEGGKAYIDDKVAPEDDPDAPQSQPEDDGGNEPPSLPVQPQLPSFGSDMGLPTFGGF